MAIRMAPACRGTPFFAAFNAVLATFFATSLVFSFANAAGPLESWREGAPPAFVLPAATGPDIRLDGQRGRVVLVHFFATWCEPCREEFPALQRLVARADPASLTVIAISVAEVEQRVRRFLETMPVTFPIALDRDRAVAKAWNVSTLPSTVILDRELVPRLVVESDFAWDSLDPASLIETLGAAARGPTKSSSSPEDKP